MNKVIITGRLTKDIELRYTPNGLPVCQFTIANNEGTKEKPETCFIEIVAWKNTAETIHKFFGKGGLILIEGILKQDKWQDKDGTNKSKHRVTCLRFEFMGANGKERLAKQEEITLEELNDININIDETIKP